jgi:CheY-like chemotaxis protein
MPDAVLLDMMMPDLDGMATFALFQRNPAPDISNACHVKFWSMWQVPSRDLAPVQLVEDADM